MYPYCDMGSLSTILLVQLANLLVYISGRLLLALSALCSRLSVQTAVVTPHFNALPAVLFLLGDTLAGDGVENIRALRGKTLEVVGHVGGGEVSRGGALLGNALLITPARVEHLDYNED